MAFVEMPSMKFGFSVQVSAIVDKLWSREAKAALSLLRTQTAADLASYGKGAGWKHSERREHEEMGSLREALYADLAA